MSVANRFRALLRSELVSFPFRVIRYLVAYTMIPAHILGRYTSGWLRDDDLWIVAGGSGNEFSGNSKYFYLELTNSYPDVRAIWITEQRSVKRELNEHGYEAYLTSELRGVYYSLRSGYAVTSNTLPIWTFGFTGGATSIQLWHGIPLKRLPTRDRGMSPWDLKRKLGTYDYLIINTASEREAYDEILDYETVLPVGYPRNDQFYRDVPGSEVGVADEAREILASIADDRPVIGYFPTWRGFDSEIPIDFSALDRELESIGAHLVVKAHRNQEFEVTSEQMQHIDFLPTNGDPYPLFEEIDILVTDYSSIYFDYLHLDQPVVFYLYDFDEYSRERGFFLDFEIATPGPKAHSFSELIDVLQTTCNSDKFAGERADVRQKVFAHQDGNASQRIIESVTSDPELR